MKVLPFLLTAALWHVPAALFADKLRAVMPKEHLEVFENYCFECHDSFSEEGNVNLEDLSFTISGDIATAERWNQILNAINSGEMPPKKEKQISPKEKTAFLTDLSEQMVVARKLLSDSGGIVTMRRLNRREYANTIDALIGVRPDISNLPDDQTTSGFDTEGASLFFSSDQLENYLASARSALNQSLARNKKVEPKTTRIEPEEFYNKSYAKAAEGLRDISSRAQAFLAQSEKPASDFGLLDKYQAKKQQVAEWLPLLDQYLARPETKTGATLIMTIKQGGYTRIKLGKLGAWEGGKYTIRVRAAAYPDAEERFHYLEFVAIDGQTSHRLGWRKIAGTLESPELIEFTIDHEPGTVRQYMIHQRSHQDRGDKNLAQRDQRKNGIGTKPGLWVDWAELEGPLPGTNENPKATTILYPKPPSMEEADYAKEVLLRFSRRAFRGSEPDPDYLDRLVKRYLAKRKEGLNLVQAFIDPLSIILSSPSFLYLVESTGNEDSLRLTNTELANRLSYFLWSAPPDDELMRVARDGNLTNPAELKKQTARLLADPLADRFVRSFVHQWLEMERLDTFQFKGLSFPTFDNAARENARNEIFQTVHTMLEEKLPLQTLLKSDFIVINDLLAGYYGIPGVEGHEFRKVSLPPNSNRGGLLGTAAVLAMGSDGLRTSPVERGAWILRHLLNDPPPPAPPNVPMLSRFDDKPMSSRERETRHQEEPQCAQCHQKIDPLGYSLENFNADGLWRDKEILHIGRLVKGKTVEFPIDPTGTLYTGEKIANFQELRDHIATKTAPFARGLAESLIGYGLGRPYGFIDEPLADSLLKQAKENDYELSLFIHALVQSDTFQTK